MVELFNTTVFEEVKLLAVAYCSSYPEAVVEVQVLVMTEDAVESALMVVVAGKVVIVTTALYIPG